jgi:hypothetical protein
MSAVTVGELIEILSEFDPLTKVVVSRDAEGNEFSGLAGFGREAVDAAWDGERLDALEDTEDPDADPEQTLQDVIVLWPI